MGKEMFNIGQEVLVITDKGIAYNGYISARATGDDGGPPAYQVTIHGSQQNQWHRSGEVFLPEEATQEDTNSIESFLKK